MGHDTQLRGDIQKHLCNTPTFPCQAQGCVGDAANKPSKRETCFICCARQQPVPTQSVRGGLCSCRPWTVGTGTLPTSAQRRAASEHSS